MVTLLRPVQPAIIDAVAAPAVTRSQRGLAIVVTGMLVVVGAAATPFSELRLMVVPGFMTAFGSSMVVINVILATLLFCKGAIEGRGDATRLGTAYLLQAMFVIPLVATFPGGIVTGSMFGTGISAIWIWTFWHAGFGLCIIRYAWYAGRPARQPSSIPWSVAGVAITVIAATLVSTHLLTQVPATFNPGWTPLARLTHWVPILIITIDLAAFLMVCRLRCRTPEQLWLLVAMVATLFDIWLTFLGTHRYSLGWYFAKSGTVTASLTVLLTLLHEITLLHLRAAVANAILTDLAHLDGLTGLCNRRQLDQLIENAWRLGARDERSLSVLMIDVDFFKNYNDHYGHLDGDDCLRQIAAMLQGVARRPSDVAARYGGEEFVMVLPDTDAPGAADMARRVQGGMHALAIEHAGSPIGSVTLSIGLATTIPSAASSPQQLLAEADTGLYQAKTTGRDRACRGERRSAPESGALFTKRSPKLDPSTPHSTTVEGNVS